MGMTVKKVSTTTAAAAPDDGGGDADGSPPRQADNFISADVLQSDFSQWVALRSLRVTCYGSSSSLTPARFLQHARDVGYLLATRGHVCVNGAGSYGCMAALNDGAALGNGHIVGVIHEMWLTGGEDSAASSNSSDKKKRALRDGGAHAVFHSSHSSPSSSKDDAKSPASQHGGPRPALSSNDKASNRAHETAAPAPIREMLVARGKDLQERKRLLVENSDALIVLPGGPGTWDELWEMACARNIGLADMPIVCVNTDGYYDSFRAMLERAHTERLTKLRPDEILHFEDGPEGAVRWIEEQCQGKVREGEHGEDAARGGGMASISPQQRAKVLRSSSVLSSPAASLSWFSSALLRRASSWAIDPASSTSAGSPKDAQDDECDDEFDPLPVRALFLYMLPIVVWFGAGVAIGSALASPRGKR